jgi:hypothetical protein
MRNENMVSLRKACLKADVSVTTVLDWLYRDRDGEQLPDKAESFLCIMTDQSGGRLSIEERRSSMCAMIKESGRLNRLMVDANGLDWWIHLYCDRRKTHTTANGNVSADGMVIVVNDEKVLEPGFLGLADKEVFWVTAVADDGVTLNVIRGVYSSEPAEIADGAELYAIGRLADPAITSSSNATRFSKRP